MGSSALQPSRMAPAARQPRRSPEYLGGLAGVERVVAKLRRDDIYHLDNRVQPI